MYYYVHFGLLPNPPDPMIVKFFDHLVTPFSVNTLGLMTAAKFYARETSVRSRCFHRYIYNVNIYLYFIRIYYTVQYIIYTKYVRITPIRPLKYDFQEKCGRISVPMNLIYIYIVSGHCCIFFLTRSTKRNANTPICARL